MTAYERVTYHPEGKRRRTVLLEVKSETEDLLIGSEVGEDGETRWTAGGTTETVHVISTDLVDRRTPMKLDPIYCLLVEAS